MAEKFLKDHLERVKKTMESLVGEKTIIDEFKKDFDEIKLIINNLKKGTGEKEAISRIKLRLRLSDLEDRIAEHYGEDLDSEISDSYTSDDDTYDNISDNISDEDDE